jgi:hypothetical protein
MVVTPCNGAVVTKIEVGIGCDSRSAAHYDQWRQQDAIHERISSTRAIRDLALAHSQSNNGGGYSDVATSLKGKICRLVSRAATHLQRISSVLRVACTLLSATNRRRSSRLLCARFILLSAKQPSQPDNRLSLINVSQGWGALQ